MQSTAILPISKTNSRTMKTTHLLIRVVSSETLTRLLNRERFISLPSQCVMRAFQICIYIPSLCDDPWLIFKVRRNETICCLIGFGIGVGCCILYRLISNFLAPSSTTTALLSNHTTSPLSNNKRDAKISQMGQEHSSLSSNGQEITVTYTKRPRTTSSKRLTPERLPLNRIETKQNSGCQVSNDREPLLGLPITKQPDDTPTKNLSDEMTWSELSSSLGTVGLLHDSYHSNSLTGDSGVDCQDVSTAKSVRHRRFHDTTTSTIPLMYEDEDDNESLLNFSAVSGMTTLLHGLSRRYDSDTALSRRVLIPDTQGNPSSNTATATTTTAESHATSYMSTEKGLERALEQTSRFYSDLEHIATDLNSLSKKYSQSHTSLIPSVSKYYLQHNRPALNTIDALDWDWNDVHSPMIQSPKLPHKRSQQQQQQQTFSSSLPRLNTMKTKTRRKLLPHCRQTDYNESDLECHSSRSYDYTSSPLRRRPSSVYFDSTDNTSGDENLADETLHVPTSPSVLTSQKAEFFLTRN